MTDFLDYASNDIIQSPIAKIVSSAKVDLKATIKPPPIAISIGTYTQGTQTWPCRFGTYGNFSVIVGPSKSKKTFLKSLLIASFIGGNTKNYNGNIKGNNNGKYIIDIDTEQGEWDAQHVFKRVERLTKIESDKYVCFGLRPYTAKERVEAIEYLIYESEYRDNIALIGIDGIADLITDFNNVEESNMIVQKLMKWTDDTKAHIINVVHQTASSIKATGHLGSYLNKKAETVCNVRQEDDAIEVTFPYTRSVSPESFKFAVNEDGLPFVVGSQITTIEEKSVIQPNKNFESDPF